MAKKKCNPLTPGHCDTLNEVLGMTAETDQIIKKCENCGLDVTQAREDNDAMRHVAERIKHEFFPDRS